MIVPTQALANDWSRTSFCVDNKHTRSKIQALLWADQDPSRVVFNFNDEFWKQQDWTTEPQESWQELCVQRAKQLREQNQKIIMWFSGGYDSLTMAWAFVWAGTYVDEIVIYDKNWYNEGDYHYAMKLAHEFKKLYWPNVVIRDFIITHDLTNQFYASHKQDWIFTEWFRPDFTKNSRLSAINAEIDLLKELDNPQTIMIDGFDKPRLDIFNGNWYHRMTDVQTQWYVDSPIVGFFISNQMPKLHIKQTWLLVKFFEKHKVNTNAQVHDVQKINLWDQTPKPFSYRDYNCAPGRIAPTYWFAREFYNKVKFNGGLKSAETLPLLEEARVRNQQIYDIYTTGMHTLKQLLPDLVNETRSMPTIMGTPFFIKPVENQANLVG